MPIEVEWEFPQQGELARLRSGGPPMTILSVEAKVVRVGWFQNDLLQLAILPAVALEPLRKACGCLFMHDHPEAHGPGCSKLSEAQAPS